MTEYLHDGTIQSVREYEPSLPPPYQDEDTSLPPLQNVPSLYYRHFPSLMIMHAGWSKSFTINDAKSNEVLYLAEFHPFGWFCPKPLGARGGFILHNGVARKDPILAAAGDVTVFEQKVNPFGNESNILLPPLPKKDNVKASTTVSQTETMIGKSTPNNGVAFQFSIEAGRSMRREKFEWRKVSEGGNESVAWELMRHPSASRRVPPEGEIIAKLSWLPTSLINVANPLSPKPIFTLQLMNSLESGLLGERCILTVVMTALRLWHLRIKGKDKRSYIRIGEK
ncbi:uncharacterized protein TrAFT101_004744 [Trichoderma asperellum]|uniref:uncharacterized protein n=1 Tax=Trichoderma asperellum TaxID=101201 RepID=UPI0033227B82|nr:hypothetical protein TrAFT101_004744 [Trichoderma asperellum]